MSAKITKLIFGGVLAVALIITFTVWALQNAAAFSPFSIFCASICCFFVAALLFGAVAFLGRTAQDKFRFGGMEAHNLSTLIGLGLLWAIALNVVLLFFPAEMRTGSPFVSILFNHYAQDMEQVTQSWYTADTVYIFPLYPIITSFLKFTSNFFDISVAVSGLCAALSGVALYHLALIDAPKGQASRAVRYFFFLPSAFLLLLPTADSMLALFSILFLYFTRKQFYFNAFMSGFCAALSGLPGILLIIPAIIEVVIHQREITAPKTDWNSETDAPAYQALPNAASVSSEELSQLYGISKARVPFYHKAAFRSLHILGLPIGFGLFLLLNYTYTGNAFTFTRDFVAPFTGPAYFADIFVDLMYTNKALAFVYALPYLLCFLLIHIILFLGVKRVRSSVLVYGLLFFLAMSFTQTAFCPPRIMAGCFPLALVMAQLTQNKKTDRVVLLLSVLFMAVYMATMVQSIQLNL